MAGRSESNINIEFASIKPDSTAFYNVPERRYYGPKIKIQNPQIRKTDNRKFVRLKSALNYLLITSEKQSVYCKKQKRTFPFKINFITLTLSEKQKHSDHYIRNKMLDPFLKWLIYQGATGYVWKAERQKNGNIHFHITTNQFIHYMEIRDKWNHIQWKNGYLEHYFQNYHSLDPNSTDVKSVKDDNKAVRYMFKYILKKEEGKEPIEGHNYGYSRNLTKIKLVFPTMCNDFDEVYAYLNGLKTDFKEFDYVSVMYHKLINLKQCPAVLSSQIKSQTSRENLFTRSKSK